MAGIAEKYPLLVTIVFQVADAIVPSKAGWRNHQVKKSVEFRTGLKIVVRLEHRRDVIAEEKLMNW